MRVLALLLAAAALPALAADPTPEITRDAGHAAGGRRGAHLRQIPEACARLEGMFTGDAAQPYKFAVVRTSPNCQARARFVDAAKAKPSRSDGWKFNDLIRVPNAGCPTQLAVVRVWRKPADVAPPELDAQGRVAHLPEGLGRAGQGEEAAAGADVCGERWRSKACPAAADRGSSCRDETAALAALFAACAYDAAAAGA